MTTKKTDAAAIPYMRKLVIPAIAGALCGFLATIAVLQFADSNAVGGLSRSAEIAAVVSGLYLLIAAGILVGTISPTFGAKFLNAEDADELREQRRVLLYSSTAMALWGTALMALAFAQPAGPLSSDLALAICVGGLAVGGYIAWLSYRVSDELMVALNREAGALAYGLVVLVVGGWAVLAHLGHMPAPRPLDLLTSFYILVLLATFVVCGRRGMLAPR